MTRIAQQPGDFPRPLGVPLERLEHERDGLTARVIRLVGEPNAPVVEGFEYRDPAKARTVRGRLMCSILRRIDEVNRAICALIAPGFRPVPSEGFSDRVMAAVRRSA